MSHLPVLKHEDAPEATKPIFDNIKAAFGKVPNLYSVYGHSPNGLNALLTAAKILGEGQFTPKEAEFIYLVNSEINTCHYCLSAHTVIAKMHGATDADAEAVRTGKHSDPKFNALAAFTREFSLNKGWVSQATQDEFFKHYNKAAAVELALIVGLNTSNNFLNHLAGTPIDFPLAANLPVPAPGPRS